ncbi:hypothetical protein [Amantichitinum ursilacus]|uniref:Uncharacterized protein n=1 Tax=Amantichitinum ursilacus TaxID=857265 RepID=A0A0N0XFK2_9NEIS|nr:hypothetical protein [Amantichitinum ursilacus]KPC49148.1 hypothetical protein WG78_21550 [Amantichitinum ursilacus]
MPVRLKAALIHLLSSVLIFAIVIGTMTTLWYPWPYYEINGLWQGLRITAGVDVVMGPAMMLLLFNLKKTRRALAVDMTLIAVLQLSALSYGVYTIYQQRPYLAVVLDGRISSLHEEDLAPGAPRARVAQLISKSELRPPMLAVRPPQDGGEFADMLVTELTSTGFPPQFTQRLEPVQAHWSQVRDNAVSLPLHLEESAKATLEAFYRKHNVKAADVTLLEVSGPFGGCTAGFNSATGQFIGYIDIDSSRFGHGRKPGKKAASAVAGKASAASAVAASSAAISK